MFRAMADNSNVAIVGPLSNAASFQSIPSIDAVAGQTAVNPLPPGLGPSDVDAWCGRVATQYAYPTVPLVHGFCQLVRRSALGEIGLFDDALFPYGYGEENDLCLRFGEHGYEHRIAIDCFVFHRKSASYGDPRRRRFLMERGNRLLGQKYGPQRLGNAVAAIRDHPVLLEIRARAAAELFESRTE
jgi:GT2 family glycosyltransferase